MKVQKFGGSSLANSIRIRNSVQIILSEKTPTVVVLSAVKGVTNLLIEAANHGEQGNDNYINVLKEIRIIHSVIIDELFENNNKISIKSSVNVLINELSDVLHGVILVQECSLRTRDLIMSFGERLSCIIVASYMNNLQKKTSYLDGRTTIITDSNYGNANVNLEASYKAIKKQILHNNKYYVVTGFISSSPEGITTTLGRNGSDYTATIVGAALQSESVEIWTDVDGVLTADPRIVKKAFVIPQLSLEEAMELSYFGAEVIHPYTLIPTMEKKIPVIIKNTLNVTAKGTTISTNKVKRDRAITGIASISDVSLINIEGGGMMGKPGIASAIFGALAEAEINIIMITQASSEHSICIVCRTIETTTAISALSQRLDFEIQTKKINSINIKNDLEIIAVIGENMKGLYGISGKLFSYLGDEKINILAIAQGSSERNISLVIESKDKDKALNTIHKTFIG